MKNILDFPQFVLTFDHDPNEIITKEFTNKDDAVRFLAENSKYLELDSFYGTLYSRTRDKKYSKFDLECLVDEYEYEVATEEASETAYRHLMIANPSWA